MNLEPAKLTAEKTFAEFQFPLPVSEVNGWDINGFCPGTICVWSRVVFFENPAGGDSIKGRFTVSFRCSTSEETIEEKPYLIEVDITGMEPIAIMTP